MKVAFINGDKLQCGVAETGRIVADCIRSQGVEVEVNPGYIGSDFQVVLYYWHWFYFTPTIAEVATHKAAGRKVICFTHHSTGKDVFEYSPFLKYCDAVVSPEPSNDRSIKISHPVCSQYADDSIKPLPIVGTSGFPYFWKNQSVIAQAAAMAHLGFRSVCPQWMSPMPEIDLEINRIRQVHANAELITDFVPVKDAIEFLRPCFMTVYIHGTNSPTPPTEGISSAVRFGLATKRPILITNSRMMNDLLQYPASAYVVPLHMFSVSSLAELLSHICSLKEEDRIHPTAILEDMSADVVGKKWLDVFRLVGAL